MTQTLLKSALCLLALSSMTACSLVKKAAVASLADSFSGEGNVFATDDDPQLIKDAVPFSLKLLESLLGEDPQNEKLLLVLASGYTQYAAGLLGLDAQKMADDNYLQSEEMTERSAKLCLRGRDYGLRLLDLKYPGFKAALLELDCMAADDIQAEDVEALYWTAAAWGSAIAMSKDVPDRVAELPAVEILIDRAYALNPDFNRGAIHTFLIAYDMSRQSIPEEDRASRVDNHFKKAVALSQGQDAAPYVTYAEAVLVQRQNYKAFKETLETALAIDVDQMPATRLINVMMQDKARWLLSRIDDYFLIPGDAPSP
jgi:predicted anti-sigma-YlaC factor YlaD